MTMRRSFESAKLPPMGDHITYGINLTTTKTEIALRFDPASSPNKLSIKEMDATYVNHLEKNNAKKCKFVEIWIQFIEQAI
jgi:hypothetical protein